MASPVQVSPAALAQLRLCGVKIFLNFQVSLRET